MGMMSEEDEVRAVAEVAQRLAASFPDVAPDVVQDTVHASHQRFAGSPIRDFVPVLVERMAKTSLATTATAVHPDESLTGAGQLIPRQPTGETAAKHARL
jgi:hypothetical protein